MAPTKTLSASPRSCEILLVDDEPSILSFLGAVFDGSGKRCVMAADGVAALELIRHSDSDFAVIVSDVHMPRLDGLSLVESARAIVPGIKVVLSSGALSPAEQRKLGELDVAAFIQKPYSATEMLSCIDTVLSDCFSVSGAASACARSNPG
jgi:two-component system, cell cycle sensor histidine kinase and response regulator CckA